jgi:hypothetical protein
MVNNANFHPKFAIVGQKDNNWILIDITMVNILYVSYYKYLESLKYGRFTN